jgi:hypothetical protein
VKGVKTSDPSTNGCAPLVVIAIKTYDWGSGYCNQFYFEIVFPQMTKTNMLTPGARGDYISDLHLLIRHHDPVDEEFYRGISLENISRLIFIMRCEPQAHGPLSQILEEVQEILSGGN